MLSLWAVLVPVMTGGLSFVVADQKMIERLHLLGAFATSIIGLVLVRDVAARGPMASYHAFFYLDALSAVLILILSIVSLTTSLYSVGYIRHEVHAGTLSAPQVRQYYGWYHLFIASMITVVVVNNMGLLWVGLEATTLMSAFLVIWTKSSESLEAGWKYLVICSAGVALGLLGIIILYLSSISSLGTSNHVLNWTTLSGAHLHLQPALVSLAFVFIMVGFGTKVGLAPMHSWLPDAHSQAPTPVSALLSGALLNVAMLGLLRFGIVARNALGAQPVGHLFAGFGLLSVLVAFPFILFQRDFKRLLAFSTVEHMGIISVAVGLGGAAGYTAALFQMFNHSMGKSLLFLTAGNVNQKYKPRQMSEVSGLLRILPYSALFLLLGTFAITGVPPFSLFTSEFAIFVTGFRQGHPWITSLVIAGVALIFAATMYHVGKMVFGQNTREGVAQGELSLWSIIPLTLPFVFVVILGVYQPESAVHLLRQAAAIMVGGRFS